MLLLSISSGLSVAEAQTLSFGVDAGVGEADNVRLAHENKISQTIAVTDFDLDYEQKSQRLDVEAKGNFSYLDYLQKAYSEQLLGRFDGIADLALIPQRLTWALQEDFGQAAINPFTPTVPTNLQNVNYVATGPDLYLRLGGASFLDVNARVARAQFESTPFSNDRAMGSVAWGLKLSPLSNISVNVDTDRVRFSNTTLNTDFERSNVFAHYEIQGARTDLSADLGATVVSENGGSTNGNLARFRLAQRLSPFSHLTMSLGHAFTDGSSAFSGLQGGGALGVPASAPAINASQNYISTYGSLGWDYQRNRTTLGVSGRWERDAYPGLPALDRTMTSGDIRLERLVARAVTLQVAGQMYKSDYGNVPVVANGSPNNDLVSIVAAVVWRHGRALEVKLSYQHTIYITSPNDTGYRDNRAFLTVGYRPLRGAPAGHEGPGL